MYSKWTSHLKTDEDKERFESIVLGSKTALNRLAEILTQMEDDITAAEVNTKTYELPNWDYRQAHNNGSRQQLRIIKKLLNLDQKDTKNDRPLRGDPSARTERLPSRTGGGKQEV